MKKLLVLFFNIFIIFAILFTFNIILPFSENYKLNRKVETIPEQITKIWGFVTREIDKQ